MIDSVSTSFPEGAIDPGILTAVSQNRNEGFHGKLKNLSVRQERDEVFVSGSLPKYFRGENTTMLTREEFLETIRKLERETGLDASRSIVRQIEFGATIPVDHQPRDYMAGWGTISRMPKTTIGDGDTVLYRVKRRSFQGYDKRKELYMKGRRSLPQEFPGVHALRLEYKLKRRVKKELSRQVSIQELAENEIFSMLRERWADFYRRIPKQTVLCFDTLPPTPLVFVRSLASAGIVYIGQENLDRMIESSRVNGGCTAVNASRIRTTMRDLLSSPGIRSDDSLTRELDAKVEELASREW